MSKYGIENCSLTIYLVEKVELDKMKDVSTKLLRKLVILELS